MKSFEVGILVAMVVAASGSPYLKRKTVLGSAGDKRVLPSMVFVHESDRALHLKSDPTFVLKGNEEMGKEVVSQRRGGDWFDRFNVSNGLIRVFDHQEFCLNVKEGGVQDGQPIVTWFCEQDGVRAKHEEFAFGDDGKIRLAENMMTEMCVTVDEVRPGAKVVLRNCDDAIDDVAFKYTDHMFQVQSAPHLCVAVDASDVRHSAGLHLSPCLPHHQEATLSPQEQFEFGDKGQMIMGDGGCLNAKEGLQENHKIISWQCQGTPADNEKFAFDPDYGTIYAVANPKLVFTVADMPNRAGEQETQRPVYLTSLAPKDEL